MAWGVDVHSRLETAGYEIDSVVGRGGTGTVYRALQKSLNRPVALKLLDPGRAGDRSARDQFLRESRLAASLEHPHIVPIYDAGEVDGLLYIAMRYLSGSDLGAMIRREERLSVHLALGVVEQVAAALDAAHAVGIVHQDVKPSNVLIAGDHFAGERVQAWLADFGLGRRLQDAPDETTAPPIGTPHYMAPEQIRGEGVDHRTDIYALGCLLYECLTGEPPFVRASATAVLYAHLTEMPADVSERAVGIPAGLDEVIRRALAKAPGDRPQTAGELAAAATALGARQPAAGRHESSPARAAPAAPAADGASRLHRFVGRVRELEDLWTRFDDARAGAGGLVMLGGEPGIGKTALARELVGRAEHQGSATAWSVALDGEAAPAYWHWMQVIRVLARQREAAEIFSPSDAELGWLQVIVPELAPMLPQIALTGADEGRFHVYNALMRLLERAAARSGLLLVLEDLHLADEATLLTLSFIARSIATQSVLIIGTYRDNVAPASGTPEGPLAPLLPLGHCISLHGLRAAEVGRLIETVNSAPPPPAVVDRLHAVTSGNPLFVAELVTLLTAEGQLDEAASSDAELPLPVGIIEVIAQRLEPLSPSARRALGAASVIGERFRATTLSAAVGIPELELLDLLDEGVGLGVLRPLTTPADGYAFAHALIQATLLESLPRRERFVLHQKIGEALERHSRREELAEVAHHYLEAAPLRDPGQAIAVARRAAEAAVERFAYDQAATLYSRALELCDEQSDDYVAVLQALGEAQMRAGDSARARAHLERAAAAAAERHDARALARATLACGVWGLTAGHDAGLVDLAEAAVSALERSPDRLLLARAKGFLAGALHWSEPAERRFRLAEEALSLVRAEHDRAPTDESLAALGYVLGRYLLARWGPESADADVERADELLTVAASLGDGELELLTRNWRISVLSELASFSEVSAEIARIEQMADGLRQPRAMVFLPLHRAIMAALAGDFGAAERCNAESAEIAERVRGSVAPLAATAQLLMIRLHQGRLPELEAPLRATVAARPEMVAFRAALAVLLVQAGELGQAEEELARLTGRGLDGFPGDSSHLIMLALTGEAATELGDATRAAALYRWIWPYRGRWIVSPGASALWPVDRSLGRLATVAGDRAQAFAHIADARRQSERAGARPCVALTTLDEARGRLAFSEPGAFDDVARLLQDARRRAQELGMGLVVDAATALESDLDQASC